METNNSTIQVDSDTAAIFQNASLEDKKKAMAVIRIMLKNRNQKDGIYRDLMNVMDEIGRSMQERGLTEEKLNEILNDE